MRRLSRLSAVLCLALAAPLGGCTQDAAAQLRPAGGDRTALGFDGGAMLGAPWTPGAPLMAEHMQPGAVRLPSGRVLIVGGQNPVGAEIYDPAQDTWHSAGQVQQDHAWVVPVALADGRILAPGGAPLPTTGTAELYDEVSDTWSPTEPMLTTHNDHTTTLLADGRVLVTGGFGVGQSTITPSEIYDPATNAWTLTAPMIHARSYHTATLLAGGRVLVAGGDANSGKTTEIYDPAADTWTEAALTTFVHSQHTATTLLDGKVLLVDMREGPSVSICERYDPIADTWTPTGPMVAARYYHSAVRLADGTVLVTGGDTPVGPTASAEVYDPTTDVWAPAATMSEIRYKHTSTVLTDGRVLVAGGANFTSQPLLVSALYDPSAVQVGGSGGGGSVGASSGSGGSVGASDGSGGAGGGGPGRGAVFHTSCGVARGDEGPGSAGWWGGLGLLVALSVRRQARRSS